MIFFPSSSSCPKWWPLLRPRLWPSILPSQSYIVALCWCHPGFWASFASALHHQLPVRHLPTVVGFLVPNPIPSHFCFPYTPCTDTGQDEHPCHTCAVRISASLLTSVRALLMYPYPTIALPELKTVFSVSPWPTSHCSLYWRFSFCVLKASTGKLQDGNCAVRGPGFQYWLWDT